MPRFIARPVVVEAWAYTGSTVLWPESFRLVVRRHLGDGTIEVVTADGARVCRSGDFLMRGADGGFAVVRAAAFEAAFEELALNGGLGADEPGAVRAAAGGARRR